MNRNFAIGVGATLVLLVCLTCFIAFRLAHTRSDYGPFPSGAYSAILGPNLPSGTVKFEKAAFRFFYVISFGLDGYAVTPAGDVRNIKIANSGDIGCRADAAAVSRSGDWLYLGCTRIWMGQPKESSVLPCRILKTGWIKPTFSFRVATGPQPLSMSVDAAGKHMYVATANGLFQYALGEDGKARPLTPPKVAGVQAANVVFSPTGQSAYAINYTQDRIYQFSIGTGGALNPMLPPYVTTSAPLEPQCDPRGRFVWCLNRAQEKVERFAVAPDGRLKQLSSAAEKLGRQPNALAITPDGNFAYVARYRYNSIYQYRILPDGTFQLNDPVSAPGAGSPSVVRVAPGGKFAVALNFQHGMVSLYSVNRRGTLDPTDPDVILSAQRAHEVVFVPGKPQKAD